MGQRENMQLTLNDLVFLKTIGVSTDADLFVQVLESENTNRNFAPCNGCGAKTFGQHQPTCPRASVLFLENWFEVVSR